ncbi:hypothetical protein L6E12_13680 [Actinokineospora sp. PR83]|uniref:hypothetical protein n=1 Tax=Actinokineospora sp. PR83 TaxID=2884908 RepID=UPI001F3842A6|nr:hypothetical protein [Actinokineospora sp. PR83]MCG8916842.1 hypothetical protein [Actinokineospora sp. PR83]
MSTPEADTMAELIADCADLPTGLTVDSELVSAGIPAARAAAPWRVSEANAAQVTDLDEYV